MQLARFITLLSWQNQDWLHSRLWRFQGWNIHSGSSYKLDRMIKQEVTLPIDQSTFWTDSTCVLCCIENKGKRFQTIVANHISAILDQSTATQWRHVDTIQNPADEASRGMTGEALLNNECLIQGPDFLKQPEEE